MKTLSLPIEPTAKRAVFGVNIVCVAPDDAIKTTAELIAIRLAEFSAGATLFPITGIWARDGYRDLNRYHGPFEVEQGVRIEITVSLDRAEAFYGVLKAIIAKECARQNLSADWIHTDIEVHGRRFAAHFRVGT